MVHKVLKDRKARIMLYDDNGRPFLFTLSEYAKADRRFRRKYASDAVMKDLEKASKK